MEQVSSLVTQKLEVDGLIFLESKSEVISALFAYVILEQGRQKRMVNAISHAFQASDHMQHMWRYITPYASMLFCGPDTPSMNSLIILLSPHINWDDRYYSKGDIIRWAAAASAVPYTEEVGRDVVSALLQILMCDSLRPHIPTENWMLLKKHSTIPPPYQEPDMIITGTTVRYIRGLGDIEILSFLILAWSGRNIIDGQDHIMDLLKEDFCGIGMWGHRKDLVERLDRVLEGCGWSQ